MKKAEFIKKVSKIEDTFEDEFRSEFNSPELIWEALKEQLILSGVMCSACGEKIPEHEKNIHHLGEMTKSELEDIECIGCEMKYRDSADIDNFG